VVSERDAAAPVVERGARELLRARRIGQGVHVARLGDVPVLAELAGEVAARRSEREDARTGVEMVERLLFHRVDAKTRRTSVRSQDHAVVLTLAHETRAALAFV